MKTEVIRATVSEPQVFDRTLYIFLKEAIRGDMEDESYQDDFRPDDSLHGVDLLGMSLRLGGVGNLFQNAFLSHGDIVLVFADPTDPQDFPYWMGSTIQARVEGRPKCIEVRTA